MSLVIRKLVVVEITDINYYSVVERTIIKIADVKIQIDKERVRLSALATVI
jgi:hypothetical protein